MKHRKIQDAVVLNGVSNSARSLFAKAGVDHLVDGKSVTIKRNDLPKALELAGARAHVSQFTTWRAI